MKIDKVLAVFAILGVSSAARAAEYTIDAPNRVGDVAALTNALTKLNALTATQRNGSKIWLKPGVYDLRGVYMNSGSHLFLDSNQGGMLAGLGERREDTVLLGGGETGAHRVLQVGGANYGWMTVSNLTVTGGWTTGDGGGISGNKITKYCNLVVSNNYAAGSAGGGGGGCMRGRAEYCLFADNRVSSGNNKFGGGLFTDGGGGLSASYVHGAWHCTFVSNSCGNVGGALYLKGKCVDCRFYGNTATHGGAVSIAAKTFTWSSFSGTTEMLDCSFVGNAMSAAGNGSAVYYNGTGASVSNCVFAANNTPSYGGSGVVYGGNLVDCVVTNNLRQGEILYNCNLMRCLVADNTNTAKGVAIDHSGTGGALTNVNCLFSQNMAKANGPITAGKVVANCTYVGNISDNGRNYGDICSGCRMWNTLLFGNYLNANKSASYASDIRAHNVDGDRPLVMTNCLFGVCDSYTTLDAKGYVTNAGVANTRKIADVKFTDAANGDYTPKTSSPAYDAGCNEPWLISFMGAADLAGNPRVFGKGVDIGAYECQKPKPGVVVIVE